MASMRNLKIKTSSCRRIAKELQLYEKEVEVEAAKTADMKSRGADPYDIKQQENVLAESKMMVPDCRKRLENALSDLQATLDELQRLGENESTEFEDALSVIPLVQQVLAAS